MNGAGPRRQVRPGAVKRAMDEASETISTSLGPSLTNTRQSALKIAPDIGRAKLPPLRGTAEVVPVANRGDPRGFV